MGKHERGWAEPAEINVADGLNGITQDKHITQVVDTIKREIGSDYSHAKWVGGGSYGDPGDVHVCWANEKIERIELKFSRSDGEGTIKNPGAAVFTKEISDTIKSYREWDTELGLKDKRWKLVESVINKPLKTQREYGNTLRSFKQTHPEIINEVVNITAYGQTSYAQYAARELNNHIPRVNSLVTKILGIKESPSELDKHLRYCVVKNFETDKQTVEFLNFTDIDKTVTSVVPEGKSITFLNASGAVVVRFSVHWKNVCQGGLSPCFNVFAGTAHK